jgi:hypothetical protein
MPYYTAVFRVSDSSDRIARIETEWHSRIDQANATLELAEFFPRTEIPTYDSYFRFPHGSLVCIKKSTSKEIILDCYSKKTSLCTTDFSTALRRLATTKVTSMDQVDYVQERLSRWGALKRALVVGGVLLFVIPLMGEFITDTKLRIIVYAVSAVAYTFVATVYYARGNE